MLLIRRPSQKEWAVFPILPWVLTGFTILYIHKLPNNLSNILKQWFSWNKQLLWNVLLTINQILSKSKIFIICIYRKHILGHEVEGAVFSKNRKTRQKKDKNVQKCLKTWDIFYQFWKRSLVCDCRTHKKARICPDLYIHILLRIVYKFMWFSVICIRNVPN